MMTNEDIVEELVRFEGRGRILEGVLAYPADQPRFSALIAGPHPLLGGDMRNNVVAALLRGLAQDGAVALSFNYGGVGNSEGGPADWPAVTSEFWSSGTIAEEADWADDAASAAKALYGWTQSAPVAVGYSFGCWVVDRLLREIPARAIVLISPNPKQHVFENLADCVAPLLVIHSDNDFTCTAPELVAWYDALREPKARIQVRAGEHFFRGCEDTVVSRLLDYLRGADILPVERHETQTH